MSEQDKAPLLSALREELYKRPSAQGWGDLWRLLDPWEQTGADADERQAALDYASAHLSAWPCSLRKIRFQSPAQWQRSPAFPQVSLARHVELVLSAADDSSASGPSDLREWCASPWCQPVESLHLMAEGAQQEYVLTVEMIEALLASPATQGLKRLKIAGVALPLASLERLVRDPRMASLERLELLYCGIEGEAAKQLATSPALGALTHLNLCHNALDGEALEALSQAAYVPQLEALLLQHNEIDDDGLEALSQAPFARLKTLFLGQNPLQRQGLSALAQASQLASLKHLDLRYIQLYAQDDASDVIGSLPHWKGLQRLGLCCALPHGGDFRRFAEEAVFPDLTQLDLSDNGANAAGILQFLKSSLCDALTSLDLGQCRLDSLMTRMLARSPLLGRLDYLGFRDNPQVGPDAIGELFRSVHWKGRLRSLDLSRMQRFHEPAEEQIARIVADAPSLRGLTELSLSHNRIQDAGFWALLASPYLTQLKRLDLSHNRFGLWEGITAAGALIEDYGESKILSQLEVLLLEGISGNLPGLRALCDDPHLAQLQILHVGQITATEEEAIAWLKGPMPSRLRELRVTFEPEHMPEFIHYGSLIDGWTEAAQEALLARSDLVHLANSHVMMDTDMVDVQPWSS